MRRMLAIAILISSVSLLAAHLARDADRNGWSAAGYARAGDMLRQGADGGGWIAARDAYAGESIRPDPDRTRSTSGLAYAAIVLVGTSVVVLAANVERRR